MSDLLEKIGGTVTNFIDDKIISPILKLFYGLPWILQIFMLLLVAVVLIFGIIGLIKASWKLVVTIVVIGGIGLLIYYKFFSPAPEEAISLLNLSNLVFNLFV